MTNHDSGLHEFDPLLERAQQGDETARSSLLQQVRGFLRPLVERELGPKLRVRVDGSDLIQKVLIQVVADWPQFKGHTGGEFEQWVRRILERDIQELLQREKFTAKRSIDREEDVGDELEQTQAQQTSPSGRVIRGEHSQIVREAIEQLSEEWRDVMRMKHLDDLTMAEVARRLGKSESAIARLLLGGMQELKAILKKRGIIDP